MPNDDIIQIKSQPGCKRDGTMLEGENYVDVQWCRMQRGLPRKIGGYRSISKFLPEIVSEIFEYTLDMLTYIHLGSPSFLKRLFIDSDSNASVLTDRTPLFTFTPNPNNLWQFEVDGVDGDPLDLVLLAQVAPNLNDITNTSGGQLFYGSLIGTDPLVEITLPTGGSATGGVVALHPYTFFYGNGGYIGWSVPGEPTNLTGPGSGSANPTGQKIIKGKPMRGGPGASPAGLFWSADALVRATFVGGAPVFEFDVVATELSILSTNCVIEYDGIFYWCAVDRFLMFNGVVREVPNNLNINYFYDNINLTYRQKVFAFKVPRFGEIWWCYPRGSATECTHAIIYNVRENTWYDTQLPNSGRSAGRFPAVFAKPILTGVDNTPLPYLERSTEDNQQRLTEDGQVRVVEESEGAQYKMWVHETGTDEVDGQRMQPIYSAFETSDISLPVIKGDSASLSVSLVEPDFVQSGEMRMIVTGRANARANDVVSAPITISETATTPDEQIAHVKTERRELRFRFESNVLGGDYQMGVVLAHVSPSDSRITS